MKDTSDGHNTNHLANGLLLLLGYIMSLSIVFPIEALLESSEVISTVMVIGNYFPLVF